MANVATLSVLLQARDQLSGPMGKVQGILRKTGIDAQKLGRSMTIMGAGITAVSALAVKSFISFEQEIANAGAVANATASEMQLLTDTAKEMGLTTVFSASESAKALSFLAMAGFDVTESTKALPGVLQLAAAAQIDLATAADITSNVLSGYGFEVKQITRVNDVMAKAFTSANTNLEQLGEAMKLAGPVASAAGIQFEETAGAIALMGNAGIQASMAGTALRGSITRMLNPAADAQKVMRELGISFTDAQGDLLPLVDIIGQLEKSGISAGDAMKVFGQRAGPAMLALISQGSDALREMTVELEASGGTAAEIAARQLDTLGGQFKLLKSATEGLAIELGSVLAPIIRDAAVAMTEIAGKISDWTQAHPDLTKFLAITVAAVGALMLVLGPLLIMLPGIVAAVGLLTGAVAGLGVAVTVATGPVGILAVGIGVLAVALAPKLLNALKSTRKEAEDFSDALSTMQDRVKELSRVELDTELERMTRKLSDARGELNAAEDAAKGFGATLKRDLLGQDFFNLDNAPEKVALLRERVVNLGDAVRELSRAIQEDEGRWTILGNIANTSLTEITGDIEDFTSIAGKELTEFEKTRIALMKLSREASSKLFKDELQDFVDLNLEKTRIATDAANSITNAFKRQTDSLLFNFSAQGTAWNELGGTAEKVIRAMSATTGAATSEIAAAFSKMRQEGESWKDLLLRLDTEGVLSLGSLQAAMEALAEAAKKTFDDPALAVAPGLNPPSIPPGGIVPGTFSPGGTGRFGFGGSPIPITPGNFIPGGPASGTTIIHETNITIEGSLLAGDQAVGASVQRIVDSGGLQDLNAAAGSD